MNKKIAVIFFCLLATKSLFSQTPPVPWEIKAELIFPSGGEYLSGNVQIEWKYQNTDITAVNKATILLSPDNGLTYPYIIAQNLPDGIFSCNFNTGLFTDGSNYRIKIIVEDNNLPPLKAEAVSGSFTIDNTPPSCFVKKLPGFISSTTFSIEWGGADNISGIKSYELQIKENQEWKTLLKDTDNTSILFEGKDMQEYCFRVRAKDNAENTGNFSEEVCTKIIATPPQKPQVIDDGEETFDPTKIHFKILTEEKEIKEYKYSIGTAPYKTDIVDWTTTLQNEIIHTGLQLKLDTNYYINAKIVNKAGLESEIGISDGIKYVIEEAKIKIFAIPSSFNIIYNQQGIVKDIEYRLTSTGNLKIFLLEETEKIILPTREIISQKECNISVSSSETISVKREIRIPTSISEEILSGGKEANLKIVRIFAGNDEKGNLLSYSVEVPIKLYVSVEEGYAVADIEIKIVNLQQKIAEISIVTKGEGGIVSGNIYVNDNFFSSFSLNCSGSNKITKFETPTLPLIEGENKIEVTIVSPNVLSKVISYKLEKITSIPAPKLFFPENNANFSSQAPVFKWEKIPEADYYLLYISDKIFKTDKEEVTIPGNIWESLQPDTYIWSVRGVKGEIFGEESERRTFNKSKVKRGKRKISYQEFKINKIRIKLDEENVIERELELNVQETIEEEIKNMNAWAILPLKSIENKNIELPLSFKRAVLKLQVRGKENTDEAEVIDRYATYVEGIKLQKVPASFKGRSGEYIYGVKDINFQNPNFDNQPTVTIELETGPLRLPITLPLKEEEKNGGFGGEK